MEWYFILSGYETMVALGSPARWRVVLQAGYQTMVALGSPARRGIILQNRRHAGLEPDAFFFYVSRN